MMTTTEQIDRAAIADHLDRNYKRRKGFVCIGSKDQTKGPKDFRHEFFQWPQQRRAVIDRLGELNIQNRCVWVPTSLFHTRRRKDGETVSTNVLSFELDIVTLDALELLNHLGADLIESGRVGHLHVNLYFDQDLPGVELKERGRRLARACGVRGKEEGGKYGDGELLRPMGTFNTKAEARSQVALRRAGRSRRRPISVERFDRMMNWAGEDADVTPRGTLTDATALVAQEISRERQGREIRSMLRQLDTGDGTGRHRLTKKLVRLCNEAGLTQNEALWVLEQHEPSVAKFGDHRLAEQVVACWDGDTRPAAKTRKKDMPTQPADGERVDEDGIYQPGGRFKLKRGSSVKTEKLYWLWQDRIPLGALSLLAGREGTGKSSVAYGIGAKVSRGSLNDGHYGGIAKSVIICATEDAWETTIAPRLQAADADMNRVLFFEYADGERLTLPNDNDGLSEAVRYNDVGLVIFDPIVSVLPDNVDAEKGQVLRRALEPINRIAADTRCAFLGIAHFNKRSEGDIGLLLSGSLVWSQVARATLGLIADPDNENGFFFLNGKNNNAPGDVPVLLGHTEERFVQTDDGEETRTSIAVWDGEAEVSRRQLLGIASKTKDGSPIDQWLSNQLLNGPTPATKVFERGEAKGYTEFRLRSALKRIGGETARRGFGAGGVVMWRIPEI